MFVSHFSAMHKAREKFIKTESYSSFKKALKSCLYPRGEEIMEGDWIYFFKDDNKGKSKPWRGPSQVTAVNGKGRGESRQFRRVE